MIGNANRHPERLWLKTLENHLCGSAACDQSTVSQNSIPYTPSGAYDQAICLTYLIIRAQAKDLLLWWGRRQDVIRVIDSSLRVMLPLPVFPTKHSCLHSEWPRHGSHHNEGGTLIVILNECEGSIYTRGEEIGKMSFRAGAKEAFWLPFAS